MPASADLPETDHASHDGAAYRCLLEEIARGDRPPSARRRETELAERLGISRTPAREAIRQLEADGLVAQIPRKGASIRQLDYPEVMERYEMRAALEGTAVRLAARAASEMELDALEVLNGKMAEASGQAAYILNRQFHLMLLDAAKNRYLVKSMQSLQKTLLIIEKSTLMDAPRAADAVAEHARVLRALRHRERPIDTA